MSYQSRIVGEADMPVAEFLANPWNWRIHPREQQEAIDAILTEVGWVQRVIVNHRTGHLIDGHARVQAAEEQGEATVPALLVDLDEEEEELVVATLNRFEAMAVPDKEKLMELCSQVRADRQPLIDLLASRPPNSVTTAPRDLTPFRGDDVHLSLRIPRQAYDVFVGLVEDYPGETDSERFVAYLLDL